MSPSRTVPVAIAICKINLSMAGSDSLSSKTPTVTISAAPHSIATELRDTPQKSTLVIEKPNHMASPPSSGVVLLCTLRASFGTSSAPIA